MEKVSRQEGTADIALRYLIFFISIGGGVRGDMGMFQALTVTSERPLLYVGWRFNRFEEATKSRRNLNGCGEVGR